MKDLSKQQRQAIIRELVASKKIRTHHELNDHLRKRGVIATQATLSRDLLALGIYKERGSQSYSFRRDEIKDETAIANTLAVFIDKIEPAGNMVVIRTKPGAAQNVAVMVDALDIPEIIGTVAGDDTIFAATAAAKAAERTANNIKRRLTEERRNRE